MEYEPFSFHGHRLQGQASNMGERWGNHTLR